MAIICIRWIHEENLFFFGAGRLKMNRKYSLVNIQKISKISILNRSINELYMGCFSIANCYKLPEGNY